MRYFDARLYSLRDSRLSEPRYDIAYAARYIRMPVWTLRAWAYEQDHFRPVLALPTRGYLSFVNLVEAFVLHAIRRRNIIARPKIREAIASVEQAFQVEHPLACRKFKTCGVDLLLQSALGSRNASRGGQNKMDAIMADLERVEWDSFERPIALFPLMRDRDDESRRVKISPFVSFGKPVISGTGISTSIIAERFCAGESVNELSRDYRISSEDIEEAVRAERALSAALS